MKLKLKIRDKLLLYILGTSVVIYAVAFAYIFNIMVEDARTNAIELTNEIAEKYASVASSELNEDVVVARSVMNAHIMYPTATPQEREKYFDPILDQTLRQYPKYMSVWTTWELSAIDENYTKSYGRTRVVCYKLNGMIATRIDTVDTDGDKVGSLYYTIKVEPKEVLLNPYYDSYTDKAEDNILMASVVVPMFVKNKFAGIAGIDVALERFQYLAKDMAKIEGAHAFFISNNGNFVAFSDKNELINKNLHDFFGSETNKHELAEKIQKGESYGFNFIYTEEEYYVKLIPFAIGESSTPWSVGVMIPTNEIMKKVRTSSFTFIVGSIAGLLLMLYAIFQFSKIITRPLNATIAVINRLAQGDIDKKMEMTVHGHDEISTMRLALNSLIEHLNGTSNFAIEIGKGNLDFQYDERSDADTLGNALIDMRENLKRAHNERFEREEIDRKNSWATGGAAKFADILRRYSDNLDELAYEIISQLVKYLDANQGGLFILTSDTKNNQRYIDLIGSYAYNRRKMLQKRIPYGVGLVGRCIQESETIIINRVPDEYVNITSGLGEGNPNRLIIVPLIFNSEVFGAIEIASFIEIEDYKIKFLERIGESIASTISMVNINVRTAKLLEETKLKSEQMASQEEEIRQNMEEMKSAQEEMTGKVSDLNAVFASINEIAFLTEYDLNGRITDINNRFLQFIRKERKDVVGKYQGSFSSEHLIIEEFNTLWEKLRTGIVKRYDQQMEISGRVIKLSTVYSPVKNTDGKVYKVVGISSVLSE